MQQISVELIGANGSRTTEVKAQGFTTRHVIAPRGIPSIFGDIKLGSDRKETPPETPTIEELFEIALPVHILTSRWGRYIAPGPASRVFNGTIFQYHDPCSNFWDLYELSKGIFCDLGIRLSKPNGVWVAHIPIRILTDTVFIDSGLAGVERTLLAYTGIDPTKILDDIRKRQFQATQDAICRGGAKQPVSAIRTTTYKCGYDTCETCESTRTSRGIGEYRINTDGTVTLINCSDCHLQEI